MCFIHCFNGISQEIYVSALFDLISLFGWGPTDENMVWKIFEIAPWPLGHFAVTAPVNPEKWGRVSA